MKRYQLLEQLGRGAIGTVWRARREDDGLELALKVAHQHDLAPILAAEALHASLAISPQLPELLDLGTGELSGEYFEAGSAEPPTSGHAFIAIRWLPGQGLATTAASHVNRNDLALRLARELGAALSALHDVGLAHGDIKPANIVCHPERIGLIDLGLTGPAHAVEVRGGTPRYLGRCDRDLGDARARDLLALGMVIAETANVRVAESDDGLNAAREAELPGAIGTICRALLAPEPGARPSARWVRQVADRETMHQAATDDHSAHHNLRHLRATYLRLWRDQLGKAIGASDDASPWLHEAVDVATRARAMCVSSKQSVPAQFRISKELRLGPLNLEQRQRWLISMVGSAATQWPTRQYADIDERTFVSALRQLSETRRPETWTLSDIDRALKGRPGLRRSTAAPPPGESLDAKAATQLSIAIMHSPSDRLALECIEHLGPAAPEDLRLAAADALRLAGQLGRARSLVIGVAHGGPIVADVLRRAGDLAGARQAAQQCLDRNEDPTGRASACLARIQLDQERLDEAKATISRGPLGAPLEEVAALLAMKKGDQAQALVHAERGRALADTPETRARLAATVAFVNRHVDPIGTRIGYQDAVAHAEQAGAVLEEASYRIGEAVACIDLGQLDAGIQSARRAALLWEDVLNRPGMAARAYLAIAGAYNAVQASHEARNAAENARERALTTNDARAVAYACLAIADAGEPQESRAVMASREAAEILVNRNDEATVMSEDGVQALARVLTHDPDALSSAQRTAIDHAAASERDLSASCRLMWWGARAKQSDQLADLDDKELIIRELLALSDCDTPVSTIGKAMHAGCKLARSLDDGNAHAKLDEARMHAANRIRGLKGEARACPWRRAHENRAPHPDLNSNQTIDLQRLVQALSERENLGQLLNRVVDVLLLWTGAERGLLLLANDQGELEPRCARNIDRDDLIEEQRKLSTRLAQQALQSGEPVVAIDAMEELSDSYHSVHALKLRSVLAVPLLARGNTVGVAYLDDRARRGAFGEQELAMARTVAPIAALAITDARSQDNLRRAARRAEHTADQLEHELAVKETALDVAERELARAMDTRETRFSYDEIIGDSPAVRTMLKLVDRVAPSDLPVLVRGESGSGKELLARAIVRHSPRKDQAFVGENCGSLPENLLESTLFGHVRGAFTGAHRSHIGLFEAADHGTLFLDEVGEMSLGMQTKLLRILEDGLVRPVGGNQARQIDIRLIAATHRNLEQMVEEGSFREDLYYRLNVISIDIPPLRERAGDIALLAEHLIAKHAPQRKVKLSREAQSHLMTFNWPGNVRQLENEIRRALVMCEEVIHREHLTVGQLRTDGGTEIGLNLRKRVDLLETDLVRSALTRTAGNQTKAAELLQISRYGLHKMMKRLGIDAKSLSPSSS